ncbi:MAG: O-antigen ligase family protein [Anaerolineae bacterium]
MMPGKEINFKPISTVALIFTFIFFFTALVGVWVAYDRRIAWRRFGMIAGGLMVGIGAVWTGRRGGERALGAIGLACAVLAAVIGTCFLLTYDWTTTGWVKFPVLQRFGLWWQAHRPGIYVVKDLNPNLIAGGLMLALLLGMGGVVWAWTRRHRQAAVIGALALFLALGTLVLTASRGAWFAFSAGALAAAYLEWRTNSAGWPSLRWLGDVLLVGGLLVILVGFGVALAWPDLEHWLDALPRGGTLVSRIGFWRESLTMVGDYPFTGSGLGGTEMVHSSYVRLLHVGFIEQHVHNLLLQIAVEQGLPGLVAFLGLLGVVIWELVGLYHQCECERALRWAGTAVVTALLLQGIGEAGNYNGSMALIGFLPFGFVLGCARRREVKDQVTGSLAFIRHPRWLSIGGGVAVIVALAVLLLPGPRAAFRANLGAVAQTRAELSVYRWPEWRMQDAVRRSPDVNLAPAIAHYRAALALDPANVTANRRLGQIELSLGQYQAAKQHLEAAFAAAPGQRATRQLLGESYALAGEIERAAALWRTIDVSQGQLRLRQRWYDSIGESQQGTRLARAVACSTAE